MRKRLPWGLTVVGAVVMAGAVAGAEAAQDAPSVPGVVRFDGLAGATGAPAVRTATLAIFDAPEGGTPLWEETQLVAVDATGHYTVFVGAGRAEGLGASVLTGGGQRWLQVRFADAPDGAARVPLTSVPYALRASDADTLGGLPASAFLRASSTGSAAAGQPAKAAATAAASSPLVNNGSPFYLGMFTSQTDLVNSNVFQLNNKLGIGNTFPLDTVHVTFNDGSGSVTGYAVQNLGTSATSYSGMLFYDQNGALGQFQGFNNATHEYRINNIASGGSINFMIGSASKFQVQNNGDINIAGGLRKGGFPFMHNIQGTALGVNALGTTSGTSGGNVAIGDQALASLNTDVGRNVVVGTGAVSSSANAHDNVVIGNQAFPSGGNYNTVIGSGAGFSSSGDRNIYIGWGSGGPGGPESSTTRIGTPGGPSRFFALGIRGVTTGAADAVAVVIDSNGQLGTVNSSRRFKEDIQDMGEASSGLMKLRPVTYRYSKAYADGSKPIDYGLIAEEVAEIYPDLVVKTADGQIETVQYQKVNAMLLNEVQKQHGEAAAQRDVLAGQRALIAAQQQALDELKARLAALERTLAAVQR